MSVTLATEPPLYAFSGDQIRAVFNLSDIYENPGEFAVNEIPISSTPAIGTQFILNFRGHQIIMEAASIPDDSGYQFAGSTGLVIPISAQREYFQGNYLLSKYFKITTNPGVIVLTAKEKGISYNISGYNTTTGAPQVLRPKLAVHFLLWLENASNDGFDLVYESPLTVLISSSATAEAIINDKLHNPITAEIRNNMPDIPLNDPLLCKRSCRRYYFEYAEIYGEVPQIRKLHKSGIYTVLHGGMSVLGQATKNIANILAPSTLDKDLFLKQGFGQTTTREDQPQYLYYFNTRDTKNVSLMVKYYFKDGTVGTELVSTASSPTLRKLGFDVQFNKFWVPDDHPLKEVKKYELFLENDASERISQSWFYNIDRDYKPFHKYFLNWSSWGTFDSRVIYGKGSVQFDIIQSDAEKSKINSSEIEKGTALVFNKSIKTKYTVATGFVEDRSNLIFNRDLFLSAFIYVLNETKLLPVKISSKSIEEFTDGQNMYAQKFEYENLFSDSAYTEGDVYMPVLPPEPIIGLIHFGPMVAVPTTESEILALPNSLGSEVYGFPLFTGSNRIFVVAVPPDKDLGNAYDQTSEENVTTEYHSATIMVNGLNYKVYTMQMAIPYSSNHTHVISLINV